MPNTDKDLYMLVGEIHSDVKQLLEHKGGTDKRISSLEKKWWTTLAAVGLIVPVAVARAFGLH